MMTEDPSRPARVALGLALVLCGACGPGQVGAVDESRPAGGEREVLTAQDKCVKQAAATGVQLTFTGQPRPLWSYAAHSPTKLVLPDSPARAFRRPDGETCMLIPHHSLGLVCGAGKDLPTGPAHQVYVSPEVKTWPAYNYHNWITAPYQLPDGQLHALAHSEWYACLRHPGDPALGCGVGNNQFHSWSNAITSYRSSDGGKSWSRGDVIQRPGALPAGYDALYPNKLVHMGFLHPGNIIKEGGHYYAFVTSLKRDEVTGAQEHLGLMLLRTSSLAATSWAQVLPGGATVTDPHDGKILPGTSGWDHANVTFNTHLCQYLMTFWNYNTSSLQYVTFDSLASPVFSAARDVANQAYVAVPGNKKQHGLVPANYPGYQWDVDSAGLNFELTDSNFELVMSSFDPADVLRRDLFRAQVALLSTPVGNADGVTLRPIYRLHNAAARDYLLATSAIEGTGSGYVNEGVAFRLGTGAVAGTAPLYRCRRASNGRHFASVSASCEGNVTEGALGHLAQGPGTGRYALYRCRNSKGGFHLITRDPAECSGPGFTVEGVLGYVW